MQPNGGLPGAGRTSSGLPALPENANPHPDRNRALEDANLMKADQKRLEMLNVLRQKEMTSDTAKLVALANEVKTETEKNGKDTLSVLELRKVEQIEKLAHTVREKMKASVGN
jgi:DNA topoisomerase VI subunit B